MTLSYFSMDANTVLLGIGMAAMIFMQWKNGTSKAATETVAMYKNRDEVQDKENKRKDEQITKLTHELGVVSGKLEEKEARIKTLEQVDISRNPMLLQFMEKLNRTADESTAFMLTFKDLPSVMVNINTSLQALSEHLAKQA